MPHESKLLEMLGIDLEDPQQLLEVQLSEEDHGLIENLIRARERRNMGQKDVAKAIKRDPATVSNFERLGGDPHMSTVRRYAAAVGVRVRHIVEDAFEEESERDVRQFAAKRVRPARAPKPTADTLRKLYAVTRESA